MLLILILNIVLLSNRESNAYEHINIHLSNATLKLKHVAHGSSGFFRFPSSSSTFKRRAQPEGCPTDVCWNWFETKKCYNHANGKCRFTHPRDSDNDTSSNSNFKRTRFNNYNSNTINNNKY